MTQAHANLNQMKVNLDHGHSCADRRHRDLATWTWADRRGQHAGADVPPRRGPHQDEGEREHRRGGRGRIRPGQTVRFRVDAFPTDNFLGTVSQIRLQPTVVQNVVTYATVIDVPNPDLKLKPGMTVNVSIEIARKHDVVRVPAMALRHPPYRRYMSAALGQELSSSTAGARRSGERGESEAGCVVTTCDRHRVATAAMHSSDARGPRPAAVRSLSINLRPAATDRDDRPRVARHQQPAQAGTRDWEFSDGTWTELLGGELDPGPSSLPA